MKAEIMNPEAIPAACKAFTILVEEMIKSGEIPLKVLQDLEKDNEESMQFKIKEE
jgi:antitoxin component of RelBE/YafQ-DinJ toxin-antitoxin module